MVTHHTHHHCYHPIIAQLKTLKVTLAQIPEYYSDLKSFVHLGFYPFDLILLLLSPCSL